ncbi:MAG: ComEC/Rec2 family competence protein [Anaerorhabdus sp.]
MNKIILPLFLYGVLYKILGISNIYFIIFLSITWIFTYSKKTVVLLWLFLFVLSIPMSNNEFNSGKITAIKSSSVVMSNGNNNILVSNCHKCNFDDVIEVKGILKRVNSAPTTYAFNFKKWAKENNISHTVYSDFVKLIKKGNSLRSNVYESISKIENINKKNFLLKMIFNIQNKEGALDILYQVGFSVVGFLSLLRYILQFILYKDDIDKIEIVIIIILLYFYQFNFIIMRIFFSTIIKYLPLDNDDKLGLFGFLCYLFFPMKLFSLAFIIPFLFKLMNLVSYKNKTTNRINLICVIQSFYFKHVNYITVLFYPFLMKIFGIFYLCSWIELFLPIFKFHIIFTSFINFIDIIYSNFTIRGSWFGFGVVPFILLQIVQKKKKSLYFLTTFTLFLIGGLFHPFTEVRFIQIGQGDSILLKSAIYNQTILIDTGKNSQYRGLHDTLSAKGVNKIDALFITHDDEDHSGSLNNLVKDFDVKNVITTHDNYADNNFLISSLNNPNYNSKNENSLILYVSINKISFLLTGDISKRVERDFIKNYPKLNADVLKLAHHGSNTSTSMAFLDNVNPLLCVNSSGLKNRYFHPSKDVVETINKMKITMLDTQTEGDISFYFSPLFNFIITSSKKFAIME